MRKLLALLGSISLIASSASAVLACTDTTINTNAPDTDQTPSLRQESVNSLKSFVLADQYGMDLSKVQRRIGIDTDTTTPDFNKPDSSVASGLKLDGDLGKDNLPLYQFNKTLNSILGTLGAKPVDLSPYFEQWGGVIKEIPSLIKSRNITGVLGLVPTILNSVASFINVQIDPGTVTWIGELLKMNIKYIMKEFNFNQIIKDIVAKDSSANMSTISAAGATALENLTDIFFKTTYTPAKDSGDAAVSMFLGKEIFTPLFNGKPIDVNKIKGIFTNKWLYIENIHAIIQNAGTLLASLFFELNYYIPKFDDTPKDVNHLLKDGKTFADLDSQTISVNGDGHLEINNENADISFNRVIYGVMDLLSNTDGSSLDILKLTTALFHNDGKTDSPLLSKITFWLIDALKFTDYEVKKDIVNTDPKNGPLGEAIPFDPSSAILKNFGYQVHIDFKMKDLFTSGTSIKLADIYRWVPHIIFGPDAHWDSMGSATLNIAGKGLADLSDSLVEPLLAAILQGDNAAVKTAFDNAITQITGGGETSVVVSVSGISKDVLSSIISLLSGKIWDLVKGLLTNLLTNLYYTNGDDFFKGLSALGLSDDQVAGIKASLGPKLPLSQTVAYAIKHTTIGDLTQYEGLINIDSLMDILDTLLMENPIQDTDDFPATTDENGNPVKYSLLEQIMMTMNNDDKARIWNKVLGYQTPADVQKNGWDKTSHYVLRTSFMGYIIEGLYPELDKYIEDYPQLIEGTGDSQSIGLKYLAYVPSDPMDKLDQTMSQLGDELQGDNLKDIVDPLYNDDRLWKVSNVYNRYFNETDDLQFESYDLTFDSSLVTISHTDKNGNTTVLPKHKVKYRVWFSRIDNESTFSFIKIEKIN